MNQPGFGYNSGSQLASPGVADPTTSHRIDILCLAILVTGLLCSSWASSAA